MSALLTEPTLVLRPEVASVVAGPTGPRSVLPGGISPSLPSVSVLFMLVSELTWGLPPEGAAVRAAVGARLGPVVGPVSTEVPSAFPENKSVSAELTEVGDVLTSETSERLVKNPERPNGSEGKGRDNVRHPRGINK